MNTSERHKTANYRPYPGDNHLVVSFTMEEFKNEKLTREAGRAIYEDKEMVHIRIPGDKQSTIDAPANGFCTMMDGTQTRYSDRFPEDYDRWKQGQSAAVVGTPLKHAPFLSKAEVMNLIGQNVFTIEQLSDMGGAPLRSLGQQGRKWQQQALAYLKSADGTRDATADAAEKAALMERIAHLESMQQVSPTEAPADLEVIDEGEHEEDPKVALKDEIERVTGRRPVGNPSIERLERDLSEAIKAANEVL